MRATYRVLGFLIALLVIVQAAAIAWAIAGENKFIRDGGVVDAALVEAAMEGDEFFTEQIGFPVHALNGVFVIPVVALLMLIVSFFVKIKGTTWFALAVLGLVVLQVALGMFSAGADLPVLGLLHGVNAFILFMAALHAARRAKKQPAEEPAPPEATPEPAAA